MTRYWIDSFSIQRSAKLFYKIVANVGSKVAELFFAESDNRKFVLNVIREDSVPMCNEKFWLK